MRVGVSFLVVYSDKNYGGKFHNHGMSKLFKT